MIKKYLLLAILPMLMLFSPAFAANNVDHTKIMGANECGECHKDEVKVWKKTKHYRTFNELARRDKAKEIAEKMGVKRIKKDSTCMNCHFLNKEEGGELTPISGIACESCHTPAKDWIKVHNDFGGKDAKKEDESPEHRAKRLADIEKTTMIRPRDVYELTQNCYQCHLVPNEKLVNVGGHKAGSEFELVAYSQGDNRHNFVRSADGKQNVESSLERRRVLYIVGQALELEHSLRGVAKATEKAKFAVTMAKRVKIASNKLTEINGKLNLPEIKQMLDAASSAKLTVNNEAQLTAAAEKVAAANKKLAKADGSAFGAIDSLLPSAGDYKQKPD